MTTKTCEECGAEFTVDRAHYTRRMCSTECAHASWWRQSKDRVAAARLARTDLATRLRAEPVGHVPSGRIVDGLVVR